MTKSINEKLQELEDKILELERFQRTKVDCEIFDQEIANIKGMLNVLSTGDKQALAQYMTTTGPSISSKDLSRFREAANKIDSLEELLNKLMK